MDDTTKYAKRVISGEILACKSVQQACKRHLDDLENQTEYVWDFSYASKVIEFMEMLPDVKTGKSYPLADFQKFIVGSLYGWRRKDNLEWRRFTRAFISLARKNGKTILIAGILLYEFLFGKDPAMSRQLFCTANDRKQSKIAFDMARKQLDALRAKFPEIRKASKKTRDELKNLKDESYITYLSRETGAIDGFEPYVGVFDEYGASKTTEMMELIESGQGQLHNPLVLIISTANFNLNAPMFTIEYPRCKKILSGELKDEQYFGFIAEQDSVEEIEDETMWLKSNPILCVESLKETVTDYLRKRWKTAKETGQTIKVLVKNFNLWTQGSEDSYMDINDWNNAIIEEQDIRGRKAWIGVDVGRTSDLFSISWAVQMDGYFYVDSFSFVATKYGLDTKEKRDGVNYRYLESKGECKITELESGVIDYDEVYEWLDEFIYTHELEVQCIAYDPHQYGHILTSVEKNHPEWPQVEIRQGTLTLNMPTKQFRDDVKDLKVRHSGNELLTAAINNAITKVDNNGMRIDKNKNSNKIDPVDALLDAYAMCYLEFSSGGFWTDDKILNDLEFGF
jgi:phage terminase large subunit-like protein